MPALVANHGAERAPRNFGGGDRKFGNGPREGGFGGGARTNQAPPREFGNQSRDFGGAAREGFSYERKGGFNDRFAGSRPDAAPRGGDFAARKPAFQAVLREWIRFA